MSFHMLITLRPLENKPVGDQHVEAHVAKLLYVALAYAAYACQVKCLGQMSFHMLITHNPFEKGCGL